MANIPPPGPSLDEGLDRVEAELLRLDPTGDRVARVIRATLDQLYDGQRTGRWSFDQLYKTEKTHMGTLVEINLQREFGFADGDATDYRIAGVQVDCKYSMNGAWTLPPEVIGHVALLVTADDARSSWKAGLLRVRTEHLNPGRNRDAKATLSALGRSLIRELWPGHRTLQPNLLLQMPGPTREQILAPGGRPARSGQARINQLFRLVQRQIIRRNDLATVGQQDDFMKRARSNGGARTALQREGILVLGHQDSDPAIARGLGLPVPAKGEFVSVRVVPQPTPDRLPAIEINHVPWVVAELGDPVVAAPSVPKAASAVRLIPQPGAEVAFTSTDETDALFQSDQVFLE